MVEGIERKSVTCSFCFNDANLVAYFVRTVKPFRYTWDTGTENIIYGKTAEASAMTLLKRKTRIRPSFIKILSGIPLIDTWEWQIIPVLLRTEDGQDLTKCKASWISLNELQNYEPPKDVHPVVLHVLNVYGSTMLGHVPPRSNVKNLMVL